MNTELQMLSCSIVLGILQIFVGASASTKQRGIEWNMSSRDQPKPPLTGVPGRLARALENFKETFPFFLGSVLLVQVLGKQSSTTAIGAEMYFWARLLYVPIYAYNITKVRTVVWAVSMAGIIMLLVGALH